MYRVNRVRVVGQEFEKVEARLDGETAVLQPRQLQAIPLFSALDESVLAAFAQRLAVRQVRSGMPARARWVRSWSSSSPARRSSK